MKILFGPDAPRLAEQDIAEYINCERYQFLADSIFEALEAGTLTEEETHEQLNAIIDAMQKELEAVFEHIDKATAKIAMMYSGNDTVH